MAATPQFELLGLDIQSLTDLIRGLGEPEYRARQLFRAIYGQRVSTLGEVTTLPLALRRQQADAWTIGMPALQHKFCSVDGTIRYLLRLGDGELVEAVWMPEGDGTETESDGSDSPPASVMATAEQSTPGTRFRRATICISSQAGCAAGCQFCLTGQLGVKRSLRAGEIVGQVLLILNDHQVQLEQERLNLVFMGMGEPFLNYENFVQAVRLLVTGVGVPEARMTVSTVGIVPGIQALGNEAIRPRLAISLNAARDELRNTLMPINRKWNLQQLLGAARAFPLRPRERLTFEYVLLSGVNDSAEDARQTVTLLRDLSCKINLIALNPGPGIPFSTPESIRVTEFQSALLKAGIPAFIRKPRGRDIFAACGQLKKATLADSDGESTTS